MTENDRKCQKEKQKKFGKMTEHVRKMTEKYQKNDRRMSVTEN